LIKYAAQAFQISSELTICAHMANDRTLPPSVRRDSERTEMELVWPAHEYLAGYVEALDRGWTPDNIRAEAGREERERIRKDPGAISRAAGRS
jgi:hypothetical protein